jgi:hypothetical protein
MKEIQKTDKKIWAIAHDANTVFHPVELEAGLTLSTGQPFLEQFETEEEMVIRLTDLTGDPELWEKTKAQNNPEEAEEDFSGFEEI